jgi:hypothetical protein
VYNVNVHAVSFVGKRKGKENLEDIGGDGKIILK